MSPYAYVYIMASRRNGTLYTGITSALRSRVWQHKNGEGSSFTAKYGVTQLVYFEGHKDVDAAIAREKAIKNWKRAWKLQLIERDNPDWRDLYADICNP